METHGVLKRIFKRAKLYAILADYPKPFPEHDREVGRALPAAENQKLFTMAASCPSWMVAHCAAVLAVNTTCRAKELKNLCWRHVDLLAGTITVYVPKGRTAGLRTIPLNDDATAALARLRERAEAENCADADHYVFPTCEHNRLDPTKPQKSWRTSWRNLTVASGLKGYRFHDLRHQAVTEMAEQGAPDPVIQALAGHMSKRMQDHYSHVRMAAKRDVVNKLAGGLMGGTTTNSEQEEARPN